MNLKFLPILALALVLSACGGGLAATESTSAGSPALPQAPQSAPASDASYAFDSAGGAAAGEQAANQPGQQQADRLVIKNAHLSLQVESVRDAEAAIRARASELQGFVVQVQTNGTDEDMTSQITIRVPADRFDEALTGVQGIAQKVLSRNISGDDVTEQFVDLESRLRNLEATRDRLVTFLDKATRVEDALAVNTSLSEIQGQIEEIKGRMQYLRQSAAMSTITVGLSPVPSAQPIVEQDGWQPIAVARDALRGLVEFGQILASIAIVVGVWAPVWLPLLALALWFRRRLRRGAAPAAPTPPRAS